MVSISYWERLNALEKDEYKKYSSLFIKTVQNSGTRDGFEFTSLYVIKSQDNIYFLAKEGSCEPFAGITSNSKKVIETLYADAGQNYGR